MRIITSFTDPNVNGRYAAMARVFQKSVQRIDPEMHFTCTASGIKHETKNAAAIETMRQWVLLYEALSRENETIIFADCDMMMVNPVPKGLEQYPFDIAITIREHKNPLNSGIVIARPTEAAREFIRAWYTVTYNFHSTDRDTYEKYKAKYREGYQASLGYLWESYGGARIKELPCSKYNLTQSEWEQFDLKQSIFVHIKSDLREMCFDNIATDSTETEAITQMWRRYL